MKIQKNGEFSDEMKLGKLCFFFSFIFYEKIPMKFLYFLNPCNKLFMSKQKYIYKFLLNQLQIVSGNQNRKQKTEYLEYKMCFNLVFPC